MTSLAPQPLAGRTVVIADAADATSEALEQLGARIEIFAFEAERTGPVDAVVYDARSAFGEGGQSGLRQTSERAWAVIREIATGALIPNQGPGKVVVVAPRPDAGAFAD